MDYRRRVRRLQRLAKHPVLVSDPHDIAYYTGYSTTDDRPLMLVREQGKPVLLLSPLTGHVKTNADVVLNAPAFMNSLPKTLHIDEYHLSAKYFIALRRGRVLTPSAAILKAPRNTKDEEEIALMQKAISIDRIVLGELNTDGTSERSTAEAIAQAFCRRGASAAFETIVASGPNAGRHIHHRSGSRTVRRSDTVIVDLGARWKGYCSDITRTLISRGDRKQQQLFDTVRSIQQECIDMCVPGAVLSDINDMYAKYMKRMGFSVRHGIGHGIGLDVHETVERLEKNMVITIEPGIYCSWGGCRLEDMVLVRKRPCVLSKSIPQLAHQRRLLR